MVTRINEFITEIKKTSTYENILVRFFVTDNSINTYFLSKENNVREEFQVDSSIYRIFSLMVLRDSKTKLDDLNKRYNVLELEIFSDNTFNENYYWNEDKEYQDKINAARIFYHWVNELMIHRIFDYKKENNLLETRYDDDRDIEYLSSWDKGIFTFQFINGVLSYKIELYKEKQSRILEMPLHQSYQEALWNHYKVTNEELNEWQPWNTLVIKSPYGEIPFGKEKNFVIYSLNTIDQTNLS